MIMNDIYYYLFQPNNYIAEEIIIGYITINPYLQRNILQNIKIEHFFLESHKLIYKYLQQIYCEKTLTIKNLFKIVNNTSKTDKIIKLDTFIELIKQGQIFNTSKNTKFYLQELIQIIGENYTKRLLIQYSYDIIQLAHNQKISAKNIYVQASLNLSQINNQLKKQNLDNSQIFITDLIKHLSSYKSNQITYQTIISSGFSSLDKVTSGLPPGDLIIIAGRPSTGKTSLIVNIAYNILQQCNIQVCIFSLEMTRKQVLQKIISIGSKIPLFIILQGEINPNEWNIIVDICHKIIESKIYINDITNLYIEDIISISYKIYKEINNKIIIFIDYLQLISSHNSMFNNRNEELSYITRKLKITAQSLNIPIIVLSQLNRRIETRINKQPLLSDLKESGCISYKLFISINNKHKLNIITSNNFKTYIKSYINYKSKKNVLLDFSKYTENFTKKIELFIEQTFYYKIHKQIYIKLTENHPILGYNKWLNTYNIEQNNQISKYQNIVKKIRKRNKNTNICITILNNSLVYEINKSEYCNFCYHDIILHNSIEQDADIIIMLYSNNSSEEHKNKYEKIVDINILKNRNGITGSLKLLFDLPSTKFKNTDDE
nr:replication helicase subunit [Calliblepharis sp.]